ACVILAGEHLFVLRVRPSAIHVSCAQLSSMGAAGSVGVPWRRDSGRTVPATTDSCRRMADGVFGHRGLVLGLCCPSASRLRRLGALLLLGAHLSADHQHDHDGEAVLHLLAGVPAVLLQDVAARIYELGGAWVCVCELGGDRRAWM